MKQNLERLDRLKRQTGKPTIKNHRIRLGLLAGLLYGLLPLAALADAIIRTQAMFASTIAEI